MVQAADETAIDTEVEIPTTEGEEGAQQPVETPEGETPETPEAGEIDDEVVVTIGGESPTPEEEESRAPEWVRELRKSNREKDRKLREQEAEITRLKGTGTQPDAVVVGEKPTLESCNYDAAKFEADLEAWHARKREADNQQAKNDAEQQKQQDAWQARLKAYGTAKTALKVKDYEDAEEVARNTLTVVQQGVILNGADNPAVVVYALGKNPAKAKELAAIQDPVKFAFAVAKLETQLKVTPRKTAPPPERVVQSSVAGAAAVDNTLEKLRAEAQKTGDLSKVVAYKRQLKARG